MRRPPLVSVALAVVTTCVAASPAVAKLPPGTAFEACGESGCVTATGDEAFDASIRLLEPTIEHGDVGAPAGAAAWIRVDIVFPADPGTGGTPAALRSIERGFPVVFVPGAESLGVPGEDGAYRWVPMRPSVTRAYADIAEGVQPFPTQTLAELHRLAVARAGTEGASGSPDDRGDGLPQWLMVGLAAATAVSLAGGLARAGIRLRHQRAQRAALHVGGRSSDDDGLVLRARHRRSTS